MADLHSVQLAVKAGLDAGAIAGFTVYEEWPDVVNIESGGGCSCVVNTTSIDYGLTFGADRSQVNVELHLFVAMAAGFKNAQENMAPYIANTGTKSILQLIRNDPYLQGNVLYCLPPTRVRDYGVKDLGPEGGAIYVLGAVIDLEIHVN